jgi:hypothetical protein
MGLTHGYQETEQHGKKYFIYRQQGKKRGAKNRTRK